MPAISCVYCGATHATPAEVRACWERSQHGTVAPEVTPASRPQRTSPAMSAAVATSAPPARPARVRLAGASLAPPPGLGRNVVVSDRSHAPAPWQSAEVVVVDDDVLRDPGAAIGALWAAAHAARGVVIELRADLPHHTDVGTWSVDHRALHVVGPRHRFGADELSHLVWSNAVDLGDADQPRWWLADAAAAAGARAGGPADVVLPDGRAAWLDGGPVRRMAPIDGIPVLHAAAVEHGSLDPPLVDDGGRAIELAPDQLAAVTHPGGSARIIAPAGSGKTRVLTERARHLLGNWRLPVGAVSLVAFNKRAQEEMQQRTADLPGLHVRTLNSIALAIVNGTAPFASRSRTYRTVDEPEVRRVLGDLVRFPRRRNTDPVAPWIEALSQVRLGLRDPEEVERAYDGDVDGLTDVWPRFRAAMERAGAVDFDEQVHRAIEILLTEPPARAAAQRACRVMLVDEFQDLTPAHLLLVRLLAAPGGAVFGVGDDDQTIYGYNGADPAWLIDFADLFPGAAAHPLEVNYRCPAGVVEVADRLLRHNVRRVPKVIRAASTTPGGWSVDADPDAVAATARAVQDAVEASGPPHVAVLARVNASLAPVQAALVGHGIPIAGGVGLEFLDRTSVRAVLAWLRLAGAGGSTRWDPDDLREALRRPSRALAPRVAEWVTEQVDGAGLRRLAGRLNQQREQERVGELADDLELLAGLVDRRATTAAVVDALLDRIGLAGSVAGLDATRRGMNRGAQGDDLTAVRQLAALHPEVATFERWLRDRLATRRQADGVLLATVHRVKGQEWPHVVVHLAGADQFPHRLADDVEEERRLFHVAITRARRHVTVVTGPAASPFVAELTSEPDEQALARRAAEEVFARMGARRSAEPTRPTAPDHPLVDRARVPAVVGLVLVDNGTEWAVTDVADHEVTATNGSATRRFRHGEAVVTRGRRRGELCPPPGGVTRESVLAYDELRRWRDLVRDGKPAYTVFDDKTLAAIATTLPTTTGELAAVRGVGPAKLESYGDDVLALVAEVLDGAAASGA